jgi:hypothetical protein
MGMNKRRLSVFVERRERKKGMSVVVCENNGSEVDVDDVLKSMWKCYNGL